jgi:putative peptidoglycan lipid II flippase
LISVGVLLSRLTGLVRTVLLISVLGGGALADVYTFANNVPNLVYELLAGGVLSAVLLPLFVDLVRRDDRQGTSAVVSVAVGGLAALSVAGVLAAPALAWAIAALSGGSVDRVEQQAAFVVLLRWFVPQVFFYGVITVVTALLQAKRRFAAAAFAPVVNNLAVIVTYLVARQVSDLDLTVAGLGEVRAERWTLLVLGLGTTLGVVANAVVLLPSVGRARIRLRPTLAWHHPALGRLAVAARSALGYVLVSQIGVTITSLLANGFKQTGGYASWTYANLVFYVVYGLLVVSITTAIGPELAHAAQQGDLAVVRREWVRGLRLIVLLMAPVAAGMAVLAGPLWQVLPLDQGGVTLTVVIFRWFTIGLLPFSVIQHVVRAYYALSETRAPFRVAVVQNVIVVGAVAVAAALFGVAGLAAAYAGGYLVTAVVAFSWFAHHLGRLRTGDVRAVPRMIVAALGMAVVVAASQALLTWGGRSASPVLSLVIGAVVGVASYVLFLATLDADADLWAFVGAARRMVRR